MIWAWRPPISAFSSPDVASVHWFIAGARQSTPKVAWWDFARGQLEAIRSLPTGWDSHGGAPPDRELVDVSERLLASIALGLEKIAGARGREIPKPDIDPTPSGGVQFSWDSGPKYCEVELLAANRAHFYFVDHGQPREQEGDLHAGDKVNPLCELILSVNS